MEKGGIKTISEWMEGYLHRLCDKIKPDKRKGVVVAMLVLFGVLSIYMVVSSIYNFGKGDGSNLQIQRIEILQLESGQQERDRIGQFNNTEDVRTTDE